MAGEADLDTVELLCDTSILYYTSTEYSERSHGLGYSSQQQCTDLQEGVQLYSCIDLGILGT